jgi:hypothetical protein
MRAVRAGFRGADARSLWVRGRNPIDATEKIEIEAPELL